jgi:hypothetical protein
MIIDTDDLEALGFGSQYEALALSGWAERATTKAHEYQRAWRAENKQKLRAYQRQWLKTPKGKEYTKRHGSTAASKAARKRWAQSERGKANRRASTRRYTQTAKGKANRDRYEASEAGKARRKRANAKYLASPKGKAMRARAYARRKALRGEL